MINWTTTKKTIHDWIATITELPLNKVIWEKPNAPRPDMPYISLGKPTQLTTDETPDQLYDETSESFKTYVTRRFVISVEVYGDNPLTITDYIRNRVEDMDYCQSLKAEGIAVVGILAIIDATEFINEEYEEKYSVDIEFYIRDINELTNTIPIDKVSLTGDIDGREISQEQIGG